MSKIIPITCKSYLNPRPNHLDRTLVDNLFKKICKYTPSIVKERVIFCIKAFTGEKTFDNKKRLYMNEIEKLFPQKAKTTMLFLERNKRTIIRHFITNGYAGVSTMIIRHEKLNKITIHKIENVVNLLSKPNVKITTDGNIMIGAVLLKRKGSNKPDAVQYQAAVDYSILLNDYKKITCVIGQQGKYEII